MKWLEHSFTNVAHLVFIAALSESDFLKYVRKADDPYRKTDPGYNGRYQMAAFFSTFVFALLDLAIYSYFLRVGHIYQQVADAEDVPVQAYKPKPIATEEEVKESM